MDDAGEVGLELGFFFRRVKQGDAAGDLIRGHVVKSRG